MFLLKPTCWQHWRRSVCSCRYQGELYLQLQRYKQVQECGTVFHASFERLAETPIKSAVPPPSGQGCQLQIYPAFDKITRLFQVFLSTENVEDVHENLPVSCFKLCAIVDILSSQSSDMMTRICSKQSDHRAVVVLLRSCFKYRLCRCAAVPPPAFAAPAVSRRTRGSCARGVKWCAASSAAEWRPCPYMSLLPCWGTLKQKTLLVQGEKMSF